MEKKIGDEMMKLKNEVLELYLIDNNLMENWGDGSCMLARPGGQIVNFVVVEVIWGDNNVSPDSR